MTPQEIAAYIGALAWLPQIFQWIHSYYEQADCSLFPDNKLSIGYTTYGPIINLNIGFLSRKKDSLLNNCQLIITHEEGMTKHFDWRGGITETAFHTTNLSGLKENTFEKEYKPIAHYLEKNKLLERLIRFRDIHFEKERNKKLQAFRNKADYIIKTNKNNQDSESENDRTLQLMELQEMNQLIAFHQNFFWWRQGKYTLTFDIKSDVPINLNRQTYTFQISEEDIDLLTQNKSVFKQQFENDLRGVYEEPSLWQWINPTLEQS